MSSSSSHQTTTTTADFPDSATTVTPATEPEQPLVPLDLVPHLIRDDGHIYWEDIIANIGLFADGPDYIKPDGTEEPVCGNRNCDGINRCTEVFMVLGQNRRGSYAIFPVCKDCREKKYANNYRIIDRDFQEE